MSGRVLVLGGTGEARRLATDLVAAGVDVLSSLAGRVAAPLLPPGEVRVGGFGGVAGLEELLGEQRVVALVDATHPFAATMTAHAAEAAAATGVPLLRLQRPGWSPVAGDDWRRVGSLPAAAAAVAGFRRVFLTTGRQGLGAFSAVQGRVLVRTVEPPSVPLPPGTTLLLARGPFSVAAERALMGEHQVDVVVTKDSGGPMTEAKLTAARELGLPVVLVDRPPVPPGVPVAATVPQSRDWVLDRVGQVARASTGSSAGAATGRRSRRPATAESASTTTAAP